MISGGGGALICVWVFVGNVTSDAKVHCFFDRGRIAGGSSASQSRGTLGLFDNRKLEVCLNMV